MLWLTEFFYDLIQHFSFIMMKVCSKTQYSKICKLHEGGRSNRGDPVRPLRFHSIGFSNGGRGDFVYKKHIV